MNSEISSLGHDSSQPINLSPTKLISFLINAKKETYAGQGQKAKKEDYSSHFVYKEIPFQYIDTYFGNVIECGREVVHLYDKPIWAMCYRGGTHEEFEDKSKEISVFLRKALLLIPIVFPVRGPTVYSGEKYVYLNKYVGNLFNFSGEEIILDLSLNKQVYFKNYSGGLVKDRNFKVRILVEEWRKENY